MMPTTLTSKSVNKTTVRNKSAVKLNCTVTGHQPKNRFIGAEERVSDHHHLSL